MQAAKETARKIERRFVAGRASRRHGERLACRLSRKGRLPEAETTPSNRALRDRLLNSRRI
jgi:hypothetical protein